MSDKSQNQLFRELGRSIRVKIESDTKEALAKHGVPLKAMAQFMPKLDFKKLMPWQRQLLINTLLSDKHIPTERKLDIMRGHRKSIPVPPIPRGQTIRGQRAEMIIYDCSIGCGHLDKCNHGKECPYDEEN